MLPFGETPLPPKWVTSFMASPLSIRFFLKIFPFFFLFRQVIIVLTQLEGSGGFSIAHRLTHRLSVHPGLYDWGPQGNLHLPKLDSKVEGLHAPRPL